MRNKWGSFLVNRGLKENRKLLLTLFNYPTQFPVSRLTTVQITETAQDQTSAHVKKGFKEQIAPKVCR